MAPDLVKAANMDAAQIPPVRRTDLVIRPLGEQGEHVVKDPLTGNYFNLGPAEIFLLEAFDGAKTAGQICTAFEERFKEPLSLDDVDEFVSLASSMSFLKAAADPALQTAISDQPLADGPPATPAEAPKVKKKRQSILYWRHSAFDPDRFFGWLEPKIRFVWTKSFLVISLITIVLGWFVFLSNWQEMISNIEITWETAFLVWITIATVTTMHEFAHGLTCKHYGGEVHEVGFLLMFFMPCFFCNVSDAWLIRERWKRLWITLAGGYHDLFIWALAVFAWRITMPGTLVNYLAIVVSSVCGVRIFFNFNPLLKLDGYYLVSDWLEIPNLRQRSLDYVNAHWRWLLWGASKPERESRGKLLFAFGLTSWAFSMFFLTLMLFSMGGWLGGKWGLAGTFLVTCFGIYLSRGMLSGFSRGEIMKMLQFRYKRTAIWGGLALAVVLGLIFIPVDDRAAGSFKVRPASRHELRAPIGCFLKSVAFDEGNEVSPGALVVVLDIPDLGSKLAQKRAEIVEAEAKLRLLEIGARKEEILELRQKVTRARDWRDLAKEDMKKRSGAHLEQLNHLNQMIAKAEAELDNANNQLNQFRALYNRKAASTDQVREMETNVLVASASVKSAHAAKRERLSLGILDAEAELARREKELSDAQATLTLLEAGTRPEEKEAMRAQLSRLKEEAGYMEQLSSRLQLCSKVAGVVTTAHFRQKVGQFFKEGDLICEIESPNELEAEIPLLEQDVTRVQVGQAVELKVRALPFQAFHGKVTRIAPAAVKTEKDPQASVTVYCKLDDGHADLRPNMTGYARVYSGRRALGGYLFDRAIRYFRTELWW